MELETRIVLGTENLNFVDLLDASSVANRVDGRLKIVIAPEAKARIESASSFVGRIVKGKLPVYGINTGFGKFAEVPINARDLRKLQKNLILSHAAGVGEVLDRRTTLLMWLLRLHTLCLGHSGIRLSTMETIISVLEAGALAEVPSRGSVGASGDLAPSAHATAFFFGEGTATIPNREQNCFDRVYAADALEWLNLKPLELAPKEGLSLINGTQLTTALAIIALEKCMMTLENASLALAMSIEGLRASHSIFDERILKARNHPEVSIIGERLKFFLGSSSQIAKSHKDCGRVQDPYSLRCAPQVHGAVLKAIRQTRDVIEAEIHSAGDNPLLFPKDNVSLSGGNFHAIFTARASDQIASAMTTLASISERRIALMMSPESSRLPAFLVENGGLNSGFMMAHVTAASLVSEAKTQCFPASVDSIPTSDDKEDHVSMGPNAGFKALQVAELCANVIAIEILAAAQAIDLLRPLKSTPRIETVMKILRKSVPKLEEDRYFAPDILKARDLVCAGILIDVS